ncbi:DUF1476 domain-containing protein [Rubellimicrobium roseum]|uniref:DUF1476 domain-containing protein n=1 Tax=Rubellimicrobium roseum TaxID=687525 RepID=A0A5C4NDI5_9RHOB|nr:DUF1476 domain-containing protein [Rubellimicrobium roseum]TNC68052.1 DUF1476 domain-containing protein [Rubellimicrobium roseum]
MTTFDDRERAFEAKFAHDAEMQFKAEARRDRLLGLWAAGLLGKTGPEAEAYAQEIIRADLRSAGEEDVFQKIRDDLGGRADDAAIRGRMQAFLSEAKVQIMNEVG